MENPFETIIERLDKIEKMMLELSDKISAPTNTNEDKLFCVEELSVYLRMARQTIYGKTASAEIPFFKTGKRLYFKKSEIDNWINQGRRKTIEELHREAVEFVIKHPMKR